MTDNEFLLQDRIAKIQSVMRQYGEDNFYISFSGGKDSTVLHYLIDLALPGNKIPRVYANTGIEYKKMVEHVTEMQKNDERIQIIKPETPIKQMLERDGYPFKSKIHAHCVALYQTNPDAKMWQGYTGMRPEYWHTHECPKILKYQFTEENKLKISDMCCVRLKEEPLIDWSKKNNKPYTITAIMKEEGGRRSRTACLAFKGKRLKKFQPMAVITKAWEDWFIDKYNIKLCDLYYPPYNFTRTGCKGCPFALDLQHELKTLRELLPNEAAQCERIWAPVYAEYRRIGYRLKENTPD